MIPLALKAQLFWMFSGWWISSQSDCSQLGLADVIHPCGLRPGYCILVGGLEHGFYGSIYWECHHPNWRTHIFQRGRSTTNQYSSVSPVFSSAISLRLSERHESRIIIPFFCGAIPQLVGSSSKHWLGWLGISNLYHFICTMIKSWIIHIGICSYLYWCGFMYPDAGMSTSHYYFHETWPSLVHRDCSP